MDQAYPSVFAYCKRSKTGRWEGLGMRLVGSCNPNFAADISGQTLKNHPWNTPLRVCWLVLFTSVFQKPHKWWWDLVHSPAPPPTRRLHCRQGATVEPKTEDRVSGGKICRQTKWASCHLCREVTFEWIWFDATVFNGHKTDSALSKWYLCTISGCLF